MGGVPTNYMTEVLTQGKDGKDKVVPGLLAAGEVSCASVHGANRLGANSLLDIIIFGRAAAKLVEKKLKKDTSHKELPKRAGEKTLDMIDKYRFADGDVPTAEIRMEMQKTMQKHAAVFRIEKSLVEGCAKMDKTWEKLQHIKTKDRGL